LEALFLSMTVGSRQLAISAQTNTSAKFISSHNSF